MRRSAAFFSTIALSSTLCLVASAAPAASAYTGDEWELETTAAFWEVTASVPGRVAERRGNWHTLLVNVEMNDDGLTGWVRDWRCPAGEQPPAPFDDPTASACTEVAASFLEDGFLYDTEGVTVRWSPRLRHIRVRGEVSVSNAAGDVSKGKVRVRGLGQGAYTEEETIDGDYRVLEQMREGVTATGQVLGVRLWSPGATVDAGRVSVYSEFRRSS